MRRGSLLALGSWSSSVLAIALLVRDESPPARVPRRRRRHRRALVALRRTELFGSPLGARLDLLVDREVLDPDKVAVDAKFAPFDARPPTGPARTTTATRGSASTTGSSA